MKTDELRAIFEEGERLHKLVWLKHRFDPRPTCDEFCLDDSETLYVSLYFSGTDSYEGLMAISPSDVEWAHVSQQTYENVMRDRLAHAKTTQSLVRVYFSDFLPPQLAQHHFCTSTEAGTEMVCCFISEDRNVSDSRRSRIPLKVLRDVENTEFSNASFAEHPSFQDVMSDQHLALFWERNES